MKWTNAYGRHGWWVTLLQGHRLRVDYVPAALLGKHYRITTRYNSEMFAHQFYATLEEAKDSAVDMLTRHLAVRSLREAARRA